MEQRLNGEYLRPGLFDRAAALAIDALGIGAGILLAAWGISFLWRYTPPDIAVRIANPEVLLKQSEPLKVSQDKPFTIVQSEPFKVDSAMVTVKADHILSPSQPPTQTPSGDVIRREVTVFSSVDHALGNVTTGWKFKDGSGGLPVYQYCYYKAPAGEGANVSITIAEDRVRDVSSSSSRVPDIERALAKCVWFGGGS